jgi:hypothetical protein
MFASVRVSKLSAIIAKPRVEPFPERSSWSECCLDMMFFFIARSCFKRDGASKLKRAFPDLSVRFRTLRGAILREERR